MLLRGGELLKAESDSAVVLLHFVDKFRARLLGSTHDADRPADPRRGSWNFFGLALTAGTSSSIPSGQSGLAGGASGAHLWFIQSSTIFLTLGGLGRRGRPLGDGRRESSASPELSPWLPPPPPPPPLPSLSHSREKNCFRSNFFAAFSE